MKKLMCVIFALCMVASMTVCVSAEQVASYTAKNVSVTVGTAYVSNDKTYVAAGAYSRGGFGIPSTDLTNVKSVEIVAQFNTNLNGEIFRIKVGNPYGESIGFITLSTTDEDGKVRGRGNITAQTGSKRLYFVSTLLNTKQDWRIEEIILHSEEAPMITPVPDEQIIDNYHDTWALVDDFGRKAADYEEAGPVKTDGERKVGMFYWYGPTSGGSSAVAPDIIRAYPEAEGNPDHPAWVESVYFWGEPVYGFYSPNDYWVVKKHAMLMSNAGVDAIFLDFTNDANTTIDKYMMLLSALHDCREEGINAPKLSMYGHMSGETHHSPYEILPVMYYNQYLSGEYSDLMFMWEGKPMYINFPIVTEKTDVLVGDTEDTDLVNMFAAIQEAFTLRNPGELRIGAGTKEHKHVNWLEEYPQHPFGVGLSGRRETISLAMAINQSYVEGGGVVGHFSDPYTKGKSYSEAFGEDYSEDAARKGYFFREQAGHALDIDPEFVFVDGWNEWNTPMYASSRNQRCVFIDLFNENKSRDFEPSRSYIKDDYYNMLVDFTRKYKGVRPAPVASEEITVDINGAVSQWNSVEPEFINDYDNYERDCTGGRKVGSTELYHYTTTIYNSLSRAKVARDDNNFYFYVKTVDPIETGNKGWMNLFINIDRNQATGWTGYDFAINLKGEGVVSKAVSNEWAWETVGEAEYSINGNVLQLSVPRTLLGETDIVDFEFKWTDGVLTNGDYLDFYSEGSVAPPAKFNYLYTEIEQTALTSAERAALKDTTIIKADTVKMIVDGGKMNVYEADTRVTPFEKNGTLYVPATTYEEIMGYGYSKVSYDKDNNIINLSRHDLEANSTETSHTIVNYEQTYSVINTLEARNNGTSKSLTAPVIYEGGMIYVPLTYLKDVMGWNYQSLGNGAYVVSRNTINTTLVNSVLSHLG